MLLLDSLQKELVTLTTSQKNCIKVISESEWLPASGFGGFCSESFSLIHPQGHFSTGMRNRYNVQSSSNNDVIKNVLRSGRSYYLITELRDVSVLFVACYL